MDSSLGTMLEIPSSCLVRPPIHVGDSLSKPADSPSPPFALRTGSVVFGWTIDEAEQHVFSWIRGGTSTAASTFLTRYVSLYLFLICARSDLGTRDIRENDRCQWPSSSFARAIEAEMLPTNLERRRFDSGRRHLPLRPS